MRLVPVAVAVFFSLAFSQAPQSTLWVAISEGPARAAVMASAVPNVTGAPHATVRARPVEGRSSADREWFRIRAWAEGDGVRVVVFAVDRAPDDDQEAQVGTYHLKAGESFEVIDTKEYGARPVRLEATATP
jgi:hypothetical protein